MTLLKSALFDLTLVRVISADAQQTPATPQAIAAKPYMGWSSWSLIREHPAEAKILAQADALKANHLDAAGYRYINVDDGWFDGWGADGLPHADATAFPNGMDGLARAIHGRGLLLGLYINPGIREELYKANPLIPGTKIRIQNITDPTRAGSTRNPHHANDPSARAFRIDFTKPGAEAYIQTEVAQLAAWGVDYLKLDFIGPSGGDVTSDNREEMRQWHRAVVRSKHPLWLEISNFMSIDQAPLWRETVNGWRIENDIDCYGCSDDLNPAKHGNLTQWSTVGALCRRPSLGPICRSRRLERPGHAGAWQRRSRRPYPRRAPVHVHSLGHLVCATLSWLGPYQNGRSRSRPNHKIVISSLSTRPASLPTPSTCLASVAAKASSSGRSGTRIAL